jgi:hypothetical protein
MSLATDESKLAESRPTFHCRYLSGIEVVRYERLTREARDIPPGPDRQDLQNKKLGEILTLAVASVSNMTRKGSDGKLETLDLPATIDTLTPSEKWELVNRIPIIITAQELDKKKLLFASRSNTANSAAGNARTDANSSPAPANQNAPSSTAPANS